MTDDQEIDVDALRSELDHIKDAMGIRERSPGAIRVWLVFGALVPVAAACSQYVFLERLPQFYHGVVWIGLLGLGGYLTSRIVFTASSEWSSEGKPNLVVQFGAVYAAAFALQVLLDPFVRPLTYREESMYVLGMILVLLGVAYVVMGSSLRAFYIRRRDRIPFYVGGLWMAGLGMAVPYSETLMRWGYAVFGGAYFVYALGTYAVLSLGERE
ncbi:MAG: hypothetical protein ABEJ85_02020 [Haloarculaceae archaeon]